MKKKVFGGGTFEQCPGDNGTQLTVVYYSLFPHITNKYSLRGGGFPSQPRYPGALAGSVYLSDVH